MITLSRFFVVLSLGPQDYAIIHPSKGMSKPEGLLITSLDGLFHSLITTFLIIYKPFFRQGFFLAPHFQLCLLLLVFLYDMPDEPM